MSNPPLVPRECRHFSWVRALGFGLLGGMVACLPLIGASALRVCADARIPITTITALLLLCLKPAFVMLADSAGAPRPAVVGALSVLGTAPLFSLGAVAAMADPILSSHWRCGTGEAAIWTLAPVAFFVVGGLSASFAAAAVGRERTWVDALIRGVGRSALLLASILLAAALVRAARKPDPEHYVASLPEVGVIPPVSGDPVEIIPPKQSSSPTKETRIHEDRLGDIVVRRECTGGDCEVFLGPADGVVPREMLWEERLEKRVSSRSPLSVRRDEKHDIWVLADKVAFSGQDFEAIDIDVRTVADGLSPPLGWILGVGIGLLIAGVSMARRRRVARRAAVIARAALGVHDQNGWITVDDGGPEFRAPPDLALPVGPVLILRNEGVRWEGGPYRRHTGSPDAELLAGPREAHLVPLRSRMAELDAFALSAQVLTAAPLAAALLRGLVF